MAQDSNAPEPRAKTNHNRFIEPINRDPVAVYIHTPFCPSKCGYCDFNSYAMQGDIMARTTAATVAEIKASPHRGRPAKTIFVGGGTPTYLPTEQLLAILEAIIEAHPPVENCEITSEANPGTIDFPSSRQCAGPDSTGYRWARSHSKPMTLCDLGESMRQPTLPKRYPKQKLPDSPISVSTSCLPCPDNLREPGNKILKPRYRSRLSISAFTA